MALYEKLQGYMEKCDRKMEKYAGGVSVFELPL